MINADMRLYDYYTLGALDAYKQRKINEQAQGKVKIAIYPTSQNVQSNILYLNAQYIGLTNDKNIDDTYVIQYGKDKLKVLYVNATGRLRQVFLARMG